MNGGKGNTLERGRQAVKPVPAPVKDSNQGGSQQPSNSGGNSGGKNK